MDVQQSLVDNRFQSSEKSETPFLQPSNLLVGTGDGPGQPQAGTTQIIAYIGVGERRETFDPNDNSGARYYVDAGGGTDYIWTFGFDD